MTAQRVLVCTSDGQSAIFRMEPEHTRAALARAPAGLPPIEFVFRDIDAPDFLETLNSCIALVGWMIPIETIRRTRGALRLVQLSGAGVDHLAPFDWLPPGVCLCNASTIHGPKLQEWSVMVLLMLHAQMPHFITAQRAQLWSKRHSSMIAGTTAMIFGTGGLGQAVARAAKSLGMGTIGVRRTPGPADAFDEVIGQAEADLRLGEADVVVLTLPLTDETRGRADATFFSRMKPEAGFVNFGRGGLVVEADLIAALEAYRLSGAVIDVTNPEPPPAGAPIWNAPRLVITPHVSCDDPATYVPDVLDLLLDNVRRLVEGRVLRNVIDLALAY
jgi:phosphoglycerate dehydrogenase-like enzyme